MASHGRLETLASDEKGRWMGKDYRARRIRHVYNAGGRRGPGTCPLVGWSVAPISWIRHRTHPSLGYIPISFGIGSVVSIVESYKIVGAAFWAWVLIEAPAWIQIISMVQVSLAQDS